jgi:glycosidase
MWRLDMRSILSGLLLLLAAGAPAQVPAMRMSLDGDWLFRADPEKRGEEQRWYAPEVDRSGWETIRTPAFWEGARGMEGFDGQGWYAKTVMVPGTPRPMSLHFGGVDDDAVVWVNGMEVGRHTGYSDPFALDVASALRSGENLIVVRVTDHAAGGGIYRPVTLIETAALDELLRGPLYGTRARKSADWVRDAIIYQVYLRSFSPEGTFAGLEKRLPELKELGVTVLWLMPVHPVGKEKRKGTLGSPYAVQDFYAVNPEFGTMADFRRLVKAVHRNGMKIIIDLVANHTSWDSRLMAEHPGWFTRNAAGEIIPPNDDWTDVADLDYGNAQLRAYMIGMMRWWVRDAGIDGFRCDVAELVPTEFWEEARRQLDRIKPVMMLSEGTLPEHHAKAFDLTYSWTIYDVLDPLLSGARPAGVLEEIFRTESLQFPTGSLRLRFNTNHDKNAWDAPAVTKFGEDGLRLTAVLVNTIPGVPLIYNGEEAANDRKLSLFEKVSIDWGKSPEMRALYTQLNRLRKTHPALSRGSLLRLETDRTDRVYAFARVAGKDRVITVLNFSQEPLLTSVRVPLDRLAPRAKGMMVREVFTGETLEVRTDTQEQLVLALEPREYRVFVVTGR